RLGRLDYCRYSSRNRSITVERQVAARIDVVYDRKCFAPQALLNGKTRCSIIVGIMSAFKLAPILTCLLVYPAFSQSDKLARGKYLVEEVARCQECHTPRQADGKFDDTKWLKGATLKIQPIEETKAWHKTSPDLTSSSRLWTSPSWGDAGVLKLLTAGLN